jgi:hypothetical protein
METDENTIVKNGIMAQAVSLETDGNVPSISNITAFVSDNVYDIDNMLTQTTDEPESKDKDMDNADPPAWTGSGSKPCNKCCLCCHRKVGLASYYTSY